MSYFQSCLIKLVMKKKDLLHHINNQQGPHFSINQLSIELNINYKKAYQLVLEIEQDFIKIGWDALILEKGIIIWEKDHGKELEYHRFLVRQSMGYQILLSILLFPDKSLLDFCQEQFISRSTLLRRLRALIHYLKGYNITLNTAQMTIAGKDEEDVQAVFFNLLGLGTFGSDLINGTVPIKEEEEVLEKLMHTGATALNKWVGISCLLIARLRLSNNYSLQKPNCPPPLFENKAKILRAYFANFSSDPEEIENTVHSLYFRLFTNHYLSKDDWRIKKVTHLYTDFLEKQVPTASMCKDFIAKLQSDYFHYSLTPSETAVLQCNIFMIFYLLESPSLLTATRLQTLLPVSIQHKKNYSTLINFCQLFISDYEGYLKETNLSYEQIADLPYFLAESVYPYLEKKSYETILSVGIQPLPNHYMMTSLCNFLDQIQFVSYEIYEENKFYDFYIGVTKDHFDIKETLYLLSFEHPDYQGDLFQQLLIALQNKADKTFSFSPSQKKNLHELPLLQQI